MAMLSQHWGRAPWARAIQPPRRTACAGDNRVSRSVEPCPVRHWSGHLYPNHTRRKGLSDRLQISAQRGVRKPVFSKKSVIVTDAPINTFRKGRSSRNGPALRAKFIGIHLRDGISNAKRCACAAC